MLPLVSALIPVVGKVFDKIFPDPEAAAKAKLEFFRLQQEGELKELESAAAIVAAEAKSEHWLAAAWRPITMLTFVVIIANNFILYPYLSLFFTDAPMLPIPDQMWNLLNIGIGGYIASRGAEKLMEKYKNGGMGSR